MPETPREWQPARIHIVHERVRKMAWPNPGRPKVNHRIVRVRELDGRNLNRCTDDCGAEHWFQIHPDDCGQPNAAICEHEILTD